MGGNGRERNEENGRRRVKKKSEFISLATDEPIDRLVVFLLLL